VRVGVVPSVARRIMPSVLVAFGERWPDVRVSASETPTDEPLFELVRDGQLDLAFVNLPPESGPFSTCELLRVPWVLLLPAGDPLASSQTAPTAAEITRRGLISHQTSRVQPCIETRLRSKGANPRVVFRSDMTQTIQALTGAGLGAAVVPKLAINEHDPWTVARDIDGLLPPASLGLLWHRERRLSAAAARFRDAALRVCRGMSGAGQACASLEAVPHP
jgi:DNA-binding transcriptional LysR family regulator